MNPLAIIVVTYFVLMSAKTALEIKLLCSINKETNKKDES